MSVVKTLRRMPRAQGALPIVGVGDRVLGALGGLKNFITSGVGDYAASHARKSADGEALSVASYIKEFIIRAAGSEIDSSFVLNAVKSIKGPILAVLGVAAVAGLIYLAYKLYKNWNPAAVQQTIDTVIADLKNIAPSIVSVPGWLNEIRERVTRIVSSDGASSPTAMVSELADIKADLMSKQEKAEPGRGGAGIDMIRHHLTYRSSEPRRRRGAGMVAA
jgi:hypothetical protein